MGDRRNFWTLVVEQCEGGQERATQEASMESFPRLKQIVVLRDGSFGRDRTSEGRMSESVVLAKFQDFRIK